MDKFNVDDLLKLVLNINLEEIYECILVIEKMKQKQEQYSQLK